MKLIRVTPHPRLLVLDFRVHQPQLAFNKRPILRQVPNFKLFRLSLKFCDLIRLIYIRTLTANPNLAKVNRPFLFEQFPDSEMVIQILPDGRPLRQ